MPNSREIAYALYGAWRLLRFDRGGLAWFEDSVEAFWRSFFAAVIVAPGHVILIGLHMSEMGIEGGLARIVAMQGLAYVTVWTAFPLALHYVCRSIGREAQFIRAVVAFNWATVLQVAIMVPVDLLARSGLLPPEAAGLATLVVTLFLFSYAWFIARVALEVQPMMAVGIVLLDFVVSTIVLLFADSILV